MSHVDDLLFGGQGERYEASISQLSEKILLTIKSCPFVYCGKRIQQFEDGTIEVDQNEAIASLELISIPNKRQPDALCGPQEI
eukprot:4702386-Amphidinium_carterae.1